MIQYLMQSNLAANSINDLMTDADTGASNARFIKRPSRVTMAIQANAAGIELQVLAGEREVVGRSTLDLGGTTGEYPNINEKGFSFYAATGEILSVVLRETAGVATTDVMMAFDVQPVA